MKTTPISGSLYRILRGFEKPAQTARITSVPMRVVSAVSGMKANAIPSHAEAVLALAESDFEKAQAVLSEMQSILRAEYAVADPNITLTLTPEGKAAQALSEHSTRRVCAFLCLAPNGVAAMSMDIPGLVQTSLNLGVMHMDDKGIRYSFSVRSCIASQKQMLIQRVRSIVEFAGGTVGERGSYPGWQYDRDSALRARVAAVYRDLTGHDGKIEATHGGLECGLFIEKLPGLDALSLGPELHDVHSVNERLNVASTERVYHLVCEVLARSK